MPFTHPLVGWMWRNCRRKGVRVKLQRGSIAAAASKAEQEKLLNCIQ